MSDSQPEVSRLNPVRRAWRLLRDRGPSEVQFWFIALLLGIAAGWAAVLFRVLIERLQSWVYGTDDVSQLHEGQCVLQEPAEVGVVETDRSGCGAEPVHEVLVREVGLGECLHRGVLE